MMDDTNSLVTDISNSAFLKNLKTLWAECGFNAEDVAKRGDEVKKEIEECIQNSIEHIISREQQKKHEMHERLNSLLHEADKLSKELEVHFYPALYDTLPLCEALTEVECETRKLQEKKCVLMKEILEISKQEAELCSSLGEATEIKVEDALPTRDEIAIFNQRLRDLQSRKATLFRVFQCKKSSIVSSLRELGSEPSEDFERKVVCGKDDEFKLSEENMRKLDELETYFQKKVVERRKCINALWDKLRNLWVRLKEDATYQGDFLRTNTGIGISTMTALEQEVRRCEIRRRENIPHYIKAVREEIQELWDKCCFGRHQRLSFLEFYSEGSSESLLERLEEEVSTLRKYYNENRCLLDLAMEHKNLWEKFLSLEEKSHDKDRLFKNRGGELLKEEKERNHIQKELPKIENEIKKLVRKYVEQHNEPFYFYDEDINEKIDTLWTSLNESRQKYKSSWQKKQPSSKESGGMKRKLDFESTSSHKKQQFAYRPKPHELVPQRDCRNNVTRRRLLSPVPNMNETFVSGIGEIDGGTYSVSKSAAQQENGLPSSIINKREAFRDINNTKQHITLKASKIPMKPPRRNIGMAVRLRRNSSEFTECQANKKLRRSSLPDMDIL
ncbi:protein regulator of cytokinesis 1-like isoform X1 [Schistocerca nitens]|uniref:protein regulator of cytokinesis 1-like isoform X1 n=1 Tax=Schistocerca nitens TaxID=7011 RepID=UPI002118630C|nr:protein regulator of cytokinesis 1-like isoform X1 [Schistocerca nitens]